MTIISNATPTALSLPSLPANMTLQRGDNDARNVWGGQVRSGMGGRPVFELQQALVALGAMSAAPDGDFGGKTQDAIKRFQWYLLEVAVRLRVAPGADALHGTLQAYTAPDGVLVDGFVRTSTLGAVLAWQEGGFQLTSPLVALRVTGLSNMELSDTFTALDYASAGAGEMLVHQDFAAQVRAMNGAANDAKVTLRINQAFRVQGLPVSGAVVPPATTSQHLIGHAVDVNIVDGTVVNTSAMYIAGTQSQGAKDFVDAAKALGLRWGGEFSPKDPPHFDDFVDPALDDYRNSFYFAQRAFAARHPVRTA
jgi:hypothetical protein